MWLAVLIGRFVGGNDGNACVLKGMDCILQLLVAAQSSMR